MPMLPSCRVLSLLLPLLLLTAGATAAEVSAPHVKVTYEGIGEQQAKAIVETLSAAHRVYADHFGFDMPETVRCTVQCGPGKPSRLFTDGHDRVVLSMPSAEKLLRPGKSGTFVLYGLCHELGHVAMYRVLKDRHWLTTAGAEGWAHYAGSVVVDRVYQARGEKLWAHDPYDYRADGTPRLNRQLAAASPPEVAKGAGAWMKLGDAVGHRGFLKIFESLEQIPPRSAMSAEALTQSHPEQAEKLTKWWKDAAPVLFEAVEPSGFAEKRIDRAKLERRPVKLELDDGTPEGKKSIAGGGHARRFGAPGGGEWYLTAVSIHGARYGAANPPAGATFDVALCDAGMKPVAAWKQPYRLFARGEGKWVRVELPPTRVPPGEDGFYVVLDFRPTATQGVYVSFDDSTKGGDNAGSLVATPGKPGSPLPSGNWMIRAEIDRPNAADALGAKAE